MKTETSKSHPTKPRILIWADLNYHDMEEIDKAESIASIESVLCRALKIDLPEPRLRILLDLYTNIVIFCREQNFKREQTSVLLSIVKNMHQLNTGSNTWSKDHSTALLTLSPLSDTPETPLNNMDQCFNYCSELLLCHSVRRPPFSINLFSLEQVTQIVKYLTDTYMRHYMLYKYVFTPQMHLDLSLSYIGMTEETATEEQASTECVADAETEMEKKSDGEIEQDSASSETLTADTESNQGPSPKEELRTIVESKVKEEAERLAAQLEKQLQESTERLNTALSKLESRIQPKK